MSSELDHIADESAIQASELQPVNAEEQLSTPMVDECESVVSHASEVIWIKREFLIPNSDQE